MEREARRLQQGCRSSRRTGRAQQHGRLPAGQFVTFSGHSSGRFFMIDIRYLGLSLIGVFLALAVGLSLGAGLGGPDRRDRAYETLRTEFDLLRQDVQKVREENDEARRRLAAADAALARLLPQLVRGRLADQRVAILLCGDVAEAPFWEELQRALTEAGAAVEARIRLPDDLKPVSGRLLSRIPPSWKQGGEGSPNRMAAGWVLRAAARQGYYGLAEELTAEMGGEFRGANLGPPTLFLLISTAPDELRAARVRAGSTPEGPLAAAAASAALRLVLAEPEDSRPGVIPVLRNQVPAAIDNIDTAAGQISAVLALAGVDGHYGSKSGAEQPLALPPDSTGQAGSFFGR